MRALLYVLVALAIFTKPTFAAGLFDTPGIEVSRAGVASRQSTRFIRVLQYSPNAGSYEVRDLGDDRVRCKASAEFRQILEIAGRASTEEIRLLAAATRLPATCVMEVQSSAEPTLWHIAILDPVGDFVIFSDGKITTWQELDHRDTRFDTLALDQWTVLGIAPAGQLAMPEEPMTSVEVPVGKLPSFGPKPVPKPSS